MKSKKIVDVLLLAALSIALTACGGSSSSSSSEDGGNLAGGDGGSGSGDTSGDGDATGGNGGGGSVGSGVSSRACFNEMLLQAGTTYSQTVQVSDADGEQEFRTDATVNGAAIFTPTGQEATETLATSTVDIPDEGIQAQTETRFYVAADLAAAEIRNLGSVITASTDTPIGPVDTETTVVFDPFSSDRQDLAPGDSYVDEYTVQTTTETPGLPGAPDLPGFGNQLSSIAISRTVTYEGRETITVPAGSFETCRLHVTEVAEAGGLGEGVESETRTWLGLDFGLVVRQIEDEGDQQTETLLLSATINGQPVMP